MKKEINLFLASLLFTIIFSNCTKIDEISFPINAGERPESITKGFDDQYFVTVLNGKEMADGGVNKITPDGVIPFFRGADEPKGMVYLNDHLYFSDVTRVWKIDKDGNGEIFTKKEDFPEEVRYLNDVSVDSKGNGIFVADMGDTKYMRDENNEFWPLESDEAKQIPKLGRIYHIDLKGNISIVQDTSALMPNPNGVGIDNNGKLMISDFFTGNILVQKNNVLSPLKGSFRGGDAIEQGKDGTYYISSWSAGKVWKINQETEEATILIEGLKSAADFYLEEDKNRLLLPDMLDGKILSVDIQ